MNEIIITGSTGVIGLRVPRELIAAGYRVTRSGRGRKLERLGVPAVEADVFGSASLRRVFADEDAVVNLLTHIPGPERMGDPSAWEQNDRLRRQSRS